MKTICRYLDNGYIDEHTIYNLPYPFIFQWGGRGTGKTYGTLKEVKQQYEKTGEKFLLMRRTQTEAEMLSKETGNPFKQLNIDNGWSIYPQKLKNQKLVGYYNCDMDLEQERFYPVGEPIGFVIGLSGINLFRGFDMSDVGTIIYDEFIPLAGSRRIIRNEGDMISDLYESINRNRELNGKPPVKMVFLSNANDLANDVFISFDLVEKAEWMLRKNRFEYYDDNRGIALLRFDDSEISEKKQETALYKMLGANSSYSKMAIKNQFVDDGYIEIASQPLQEYKPVVIVWNLCVYQHKAETDRYYITFHKSGSPERYGTNKIETTRFIAKYGYLWEMHMNSRIIFETLTAKRTFENIFV